MFRTILTRRSRRYSGGPHDEPAAARPATRRTAIYGLGASSDTLTYNGPSVIDGQASWPDGSPITPADKAMHEWNEGLPWTPLYFSLTTFVTLGYGDFAPLGWFKLVTGLEALSGVALLALFTVAWGRKLVR